MGDGQELVGGRLGRLIGEGGVDVWREGYGCGWRYERVNGCGRIYGKNKETELVEEVYPLALKMW